MSGALPRASSYFLGALLATTTIAFLETYVFDRYEPRWGRGGSFQVEAWIFGAFALVAAVGFGVTAFYKRPRGAKALAFIVGMASAVVMYGVIALVAYYLDGSFLSPLVLAALAFGAGALSAVALPFTFRRTDAPTAS